MMTLRLGKNRVISIIGLAILLTGFLGLQVVPVVQAATFTVTKTADTNDGVCDSDCSLREAIRAANAAPGADTISLPSGTYLLALPGTSEDAANTGDLDITGPLTLTGVNSSTTIINANNLDRIFDVVGGPFTLSDVTLTNGTATDGGGFKVRSGVSATVSNSQVTNNKATSSGGGAPSTIWAARSP